MSLRSRVLAAAALRSGIGLASIVAPSFAAKVVGYPGEHDNPTARLMARLFGVRELLLAWLVLDAMRRPQGPSPAVFAVQAAIDAGDVAVQGWSVLRREGIDRGALGGIALASGAAVMWSRLAQEAAREQSR